MTPMERLRRDLQATEERQKIKDERDWRHLQLWASQMYDRDGAWRKARDRHESQRWARWSAGELSDLTESVRPTDD